MRWPWNRRTNRKKPGEDKLRQQTEREARRIEQQLEIIKAEVRVRDRRSD